MMKSEELNSLQKEFNKLVNSFGRAAQSLNKADVVSAKSFVRNEISRVLEFGHDVFGTDELTLIARPFINLSKDAPLSIP